MTPSKVEARFRRPNGGTVWRGVARMTEDRRWDAQATIEVNGKTAGPFRLDHSAPVTIGRSKHAGLHSPSSRIDVPRELARLRYTKSGWLLENEGTTVGRLPKSVRIEGPDILARNGARFAAHAWVLLAEGDWTLTWDVGVTVIVRLQPCNHHDAGIGIAADQPKGNAVAATIAPEVVALNASERRNMAALF
eukprot:gene51918-63482_t